jgi:hypothetical protein
VGQGAEARQDDAASASAPRWLSARQLVCLINSFNRIKPVNQFNQSVSRVGASASSATRMHTYQLSFRQKQIKPNHNLLYFMFSFVATSSWMERERLFRYSSCARWLEWDCSRLVKIHHRVHDGFGGIAVVHAALLELCRRVQSATKKKQKKAQ